MDHLLNSEWPIPCANPSDWKARRKQIDSARTVARTWSIYLITVRMISNIDKLTLGRLLGHSARKPLTVAEPLRPRRFSCVKTRAHNRYRSACNFRWHTCTHDAPCVKSAYWLTQRMSLILETLFKNTEKRQKVDECRCFMTKIMPIVSIPNARLDISRNISCMSTTRTHTYTHIHIHRDTRIATWTILVSFYGFYILFLQRRHETSPRHFGSKSSSRSAQGHYYKIVRPSKRFMRPFEGRI